jgi:AcrR family transcriptional regulator
MGSKQGDAGAGTRPYHHGNLRDALILAAAALIEERATIDFAMVDAARRAGVSSAAPYRHFKDRDALLAGVCQVAFLALTESTRETAASVDTETVEGIAAIVRGYADFLARHPEFYDLMWGDMGLRGIEPVDPDIRNSSFRVLLEAVNRWCGRNIPGNCDATGLALKLWATAHGLACLSANHALEGFLPGGAVHDLLDSATRTLMEGVKRETTA